MDLLIVFALIPVIVKIAIIGCHFFKPSDLEAEEEDSTSSTDHAHEKARISVSLREISSNSVGDQELPPPDHAQAATYSPRISTTRETTTPTTKEVLPANNMHGRDTMEKEVQPITGIRIPKEVEPIHHSKSSKLSSSVMISVWCQLDLNMNSDSHSFKRGFLTACCPFIFRHKQRVCTTEEKAATSSVRNSPFSKTLALWRRVKKLSKERTHEVEHFTINDGTHELAIKREQFLILKMLDKLDSEDPEEREYRKDIILHVYKMKSEHRSFIRKAINTIFDRFIYETESFNGIAELLEISRTVTGGFALPLAEEHKAFLVRVLIPLHKAKCLPEYHEELSCCITQFVMKDNDVAHTVIRGLLKYWPVTNSSKELLFLSEVGIVLQISQQLEFRQCVAPLFRRIARCMSSSNFRVAICALKLWKNMHVDSIIVQRAILPIIFHVFIRNCDHWNKAVRDLTQEIREEFFDADPAFFNECLRNFREDEARKEELERKRESTWNLLEERAQLASHQ